MKIIQKMGNENKKIINLNRLMKQIEHLAYKCNKSFPISKKDKEFSLYNNMHIDALIQNIKISLNDCEKELKTILNSPSYTRGSILKPEEIDNYHQKIRNCKAYSHKNYHYLFIKAKQLFDLIQNKDLQMEEVQMDMEENQSPAILSNSETLQQQILINKQKVIQAQELALLNDNFGRALASLECFANRYSGQKLSNVFGYYDMFNLGANQDLGELQKKAFLQTQIFRLAYEDYIRKYNSYDVPENIDILTIKNLLVTWMYYLPKDQKIMYQGMINVISSLNNSTFDKKFKNYAEQAKNAKMDPTKIASFAPGVYYYNHQRCDEAKNQYLEEGKISSSLHINQTYKSDKNAEYLYKQIQNNNQQHEDRKDYIDIK